jgi:hypothetical protein
MESFRNRDYAGCRYGPGGGNHIVSTLTPNRRIWRKRCKEKIEKNSKSIVEWYINCLRNGEIGKTSNNERIVKEKQNPCGIPQ